MVLVKIEACIEWAEASEKCEVDRTVCWTTQLIPQAELRIYLFHYISDAANLFIAFELGLFNEGSKCSASISVTRCASSFLGKFIVIVESSYTTIISINVFLFAPFLSLFLCWISEH